MGRAHHLEPPPVGQPLGVDVVDNLAEGRGQRPFDHRHRHRPAQALLDPPQVGLQPPRTPLEQPAGQPPELLAERQVGLAAAPGRGEREVDGGHRQRALEGRQHHLRRLGGDPLLRLAGLGADVRGGHHLRVADQGPVGGRLLGEDVEGGAGQSAGVEGGEERRLVDHPAAAAVDQQRPRFHPRQPLGAEQAAGLLGQRGVEGDHVGAGEQLVEIEQLDVEPARRGGVEERVEGHHLHLEGAGARRHPLADAAEADDAQGLALQLDADEPLAVPPLGAHRGVGRRHVAGQREKQREGVLGGRQHVGGGGVDHQDAQLGGRLDVDVVDADAGAADHLEPAAGGEQLAGDLGRAAHHQGVEAGDQLGEPRPLRRRSALERSAPEAAEDVQAGGVEGVGDQDAMHGAVLAGRWIDLRPAPRRPARRTRWPPSRRSRRAGHRGLRCAPRPCGRCGRSRPSSRHSRRRP